MVILATATANGFLVGVAFLSTGIALAWLVVFHALGDASDATCARRQRPIWAYSPPPPALGSASRQSSVRHRTGRRAFLAGAVLALRSVHCLWRLYPASRPIGRITAPKQTRRRREALTRRPPARGRVVIFAHFAAVTATLAAFGPFVLRTLGLTLLQAGVLMVPAAAVAPPSMFVAGRRSNAGNRLREVAVLVRRSAPSCVLVAAAVRQPSGSSRSWRSPWRSPSPAPSRS